MQNHLNVFCLLRSSMAFIDPWGRRVGESKNLRYRRTMALISKEGDSKSEPRQRQIQRIPWFLTTTVWYLLTKRNRYTYETMRKESGLVLGEWGWEIEVAQEADWVANWLLYTVTGNETSSRLGKLVRRQKCKC